MLLKPIEKLVKSQNVRADSLTWSSSRVHAACDSNEFVGMSQFSTTPNYVNWMLSGGVRPYDYQISSVDGDWSNIYVNGSVAIKNSSDIFKGAPFVNRNAGVFSIRLQTFIASTVKPDPNFYFNVNSVPLSNNYQS